MVALNTGLYWQRILFIRCQYVNKQSWDFRYYEDRIFQAHFLSDWSRNMTKILLPGFKQCFGPFNMLTTHKCSDTGLFRHLSNLAFCSLKFEKPITSEADLFFQSIQNFMKISKIYKKNSQNIFRFLDNCIWIGCIKQSLLLRENASHRVSIC